MTGTVNLGGAALEGDVLSGFVPSVGNSFTIVDNDGTDAVAGTFAGLAEGAKFLIDQRAMTITYHGGDGNDVVLTATAATIIGTSGPDLVDATHTVAGMGGPGRVPAALLRAWGQRQVALLRSPVHGSFAVFQ